MKVLASHLEANFKIVQCPSDADTSIVKEAMEAAEHSDVTVFSDDTDVLCLLVHHIEKCPTDHNVYLTNMTLKKNKQREYIRVKDVIEKSGDHIVDYLLFAHVFTGCDTTLAIHKIGKTSFFKKLSTSSALRKTAATFYEDKPPRRSWKCVYLIPPVTSFTIREPSADQENKV